MLRFMKGDLLKADAEALVNTVNTVGVMGRGIALQFKQQYPENYRRYAHACENGEIEPGGLLVVDLNRMENPRVIINFATKKHWRGDSKMEYIEKGLAELVVAIQKMKIRSIAIPPLGCGLGGLSWPDVKRRIEKALEKLSDVEVLVYEPSGAPAAETMQVNTIRPAMTMAYATLLTLMDRYLEPRLDTDVTLLEVHKLMYFAQAGGEPLRLEFVKGVYGPYCTNLHHVLERMEGHFIRGYGDGSEKPGKVITCQPEAVEEAKTFLHQRSEIWDRIDRVQDMIFGFETAYGMELLSSVHWVATNAEPPATSREAAIQAVHTWNSRKQKLFKPEHIGVAWDRLREKGWI